MVVEEAPPTSSLFAARGSKAPQQGQPPSHHHHHHHHHTTPTWSSQGIAAVEREGRQGPAEKKDGDDEDNVDGDSEEGSIQSWRPSAEKHREWGGRGGRGGPRTRRPPVPKGEDDDDDLDALTDGSTTAWPGAGAGRGGGAGRARGNRRTAAGAAAGGAAAGGNARAGKGDGAGDDNNDNESDDDDDGLPSSCSSIRAEDVSLNCSSIAAVPRSRPGGGPAGAPARRGYPIPAVGASRGDGGVKTNGMENDDDLGQERRTSTTRSTHASPVLHSVTGKTGGGGGGTTSGIMGILPSTNFLSYSDNEAVTPTTTASSVLMPPHQHQHPHRHSALDIAQRVAGLLSKAEG